MFLFISSYVLSSPPPLPVSAHVDGPHRRRVVQSDGWRHGDQRLHRPDAAGVGRRERGVRARPLRAHVHRALHALARRQVTDGARLHDNRGNPEGQNTLTHMYTQ